MKEHPDSRVSASSRVLETWLAINWRHVERNVRDMQVGIAKAVLERYRRKI